MSRSPRSTPTPHQQRILQLLSTAEYLTTRQIADYLGGSVTKRTTERWLKRLAEHGFVQARLRHPERGASSERCWSLLTLDGHSVERMDVPTTPSLSRFGHRELKTLVSNRKGGGTDALTWQQTAVLQLLRGMKQLTTKQIRQHLHAEMPKWYTWKMLYLLRKQGYIRSDRLHPERGAASERYWTISRRGARTAGAVYSRTYEYHPAQHTIEHRGMMLEMVRQATRAGWSLISPQHISSGRSQPQETPQRRQLVEGALRKEGLAIEKLLMQGYPASRLEDRIDRWNAGQVGALVPRVVNDYVAYVSGQPERTALLIPHPPLAGRAFWTRSPGVRAGCDRRYARTGSRLNRYSRLAQVLPVLAVFGSEDIGRQYADILHAVGFGWVTVEQLGDKLTSLASAMRENEHRH